jgi:hypothetical protein
MARPSRLRSALALLPALLWTVATSSAASTSAWAEKVERLEIVDRAIEYHGGAAFTSSEIRFELCSKSGCSTVRTRVDGGLFDHEVSARVSAGERRVRVTNDSVELTENGEPRPVAAEREQELRDWVMARIYFALLPFRLDDPSVYKQDLGLEEWDGRRLHKVKVTFTPGSSTHARDEYLYWFDPASGRLEQFAYSYATDGGGLRFRRTFDHRTIGGIHFFDQQNYGVDGPGLAVDLVTPEYVERVMRHVSTITLDRIQIRRF